jgi:hypothetical protein
VRRPPRTCCGNSSLADGPRSGRKPRRTSQPAQSAAEPKSMRRSVRAAASTSKFSGLMSRCACAPRGHDHRTSSAREGEITGPAQHARARSQASSAREGSITGPAQHARARSQDQLSTRGHDHRTSSAREGTITRAAQHRPAAGSSHGMDTMPHAWMCARHESVSRSTRCGTSLTSQPSARASSGVRRASPR